LKYLVVIVDMWLVILFYVLSSFALESQPVKGANSTSDLAAASFQAKGTINISLPELSFSAQFVARIVGEDSAGISFYGPMAVLLVKAFSNKEFFEYYDVFNNWAITGIPTSENIYKSSRIPLSFVDIVRLFKGQLILPTDSLVEQRKDGNKVLYSHKSGEIVNFFLMENSKLVQFQQKNLEDKIILNILFPEYQTIGNYTLPKKILLQLEERKGTVSLIIDQIDFNVDTTKSFSFNIPKSVEVFRFE